jgi:diguanylate cyclase (GGDEF)-like protein
MTNASASLTKKLELLSDAYAARLDGKLTDLKAAVDVIAVDGLSEIVKNALFDVRDQSHKLAGSAGSFGFVELGDAARNLEHFCQTFIDFGSSPTASECLKIRGLFEEVLNGTDRSQCAQQSETGLEELNADDAGAEEASDNKNILLIESDVEQADLLKSGLGAFGYQVDVIDEPSMVQDAILSGRPAAVILDLEYSIGRTSTVEALREFQMSSNLDCPLIVVTGESDFETRLAAVRAGCNQLLTRPVRLTETVRLLDEMTAASEIMPERVLVIDDDTDILDYVKSTLELAGMIVETLSDPSMTLRVMDDFNPELLLIDLWMPQCNGKELAAVIRQMSENSGISIVFLSGETDLEIQSDAVSVGADDFLTKPIDSEQLVAAVRSRVKRFRVLRDLMTRDSLTNLYNHATTRQLLEAELSRARRSGGPVTFAMLDIDHFKVVNDTYGHRAGDAVIKALTGVLTHRLRKSDIVGRLGGEEFGAVLPDTSAAQARSVLESIRIAFEEVSQNTAGAEAPITVSCGIAEFPEFRSASDLSDAADRALYEAKSTGRNKVVVFGDSDIAESDPMFYELARLRLTSKRQEKSRVKSD